MKGHSFVKFINGFLNEFCLCIQQKSTTQRINGEKNKIYKYKLTIVKEYEHILNVLNDKEQNEKKELLKIFNVTDSC
jgi:hypothetical protein